MEFCICKVAKIKETESGEKYCDRCGFWWDEKYGSKQPDYTLLRVEKVGRNDSCPCGSKKKYKKCCLK